MFPQFASTAASIGRATALITRVGTDAQIYDEPEADNLARLLDSKYDAEKSDGMKRLIALMSQGRDVSNFFPQVVKNVVTHSLELKKLVYIYLVHYAEKRPDEALLAMNTFQKDLSDLNPLVRAGALRAMSGIRVRVVLPLILMAVSKCARDPSPYVRRCAVHAISKIYSLDREQHRDSLEELICLLMHDNSPGVIGAVAAAFTVVCPDKLYLWGEHFPKLCELLPDVDEWGQIVLIDILLRYAVGRFGYPKGSNGLSLVENEDGLEETEELPLSVTNQVSNLPYEGAHNVRIGQQEESFLRAGQQDLGSRIDPDFWFAETFDKKSEEYPQSIQLLLQSTSPLLRSSNSAVVMAAAGVHWLLASVENLKKIVKPILFLLRSSNDSQYVVMANIATFVRKTPSIFQPFYEEFFVRSDDGDHIRALKLDILCMLATESSIQPILREFQEYVRDPDRQLAAKTVRAIGHCALRLKTVAKICTEALLVLARSGSCLPNEATKGRDADDEEVQSRDKGTRFSAVRAKIKPAEADKSSREALVVTEAVMALRTIVHENPIENEEVLACLVRGLDRLKFPGARTIVIWMVGEFSSVGTLLPQMVPIILQYLGQSFKNEASEAKLQILNCAAKVVLRSFKLPRSSASKIPLLILDHVLRLASLDLSYDLRDRARLYRHLLAFYLQNSSKQASNGSGKDVKHGLVNLNIGDSNIGDDVVTEHSDQAGAQEGPRLPDTGKGVTVDRKVVLIRLAEKIILVPKPAPILPPLGPDRSAFVAGTMSHIVMHRAPNYMPLPSPLSIELAPSPSAAREQSAGNADGHLGSSSNEYSGTVSEEGKSDHGSSARSSDGFYDEEGGKVHPSDTGSSSEEDQSQSVTQSLGRNKSGSRASSSHQRSQRTLQDHRPQQDMGPLINLSGSEDERIFRAPQDGSRPTTNEKSLNDFGLPSAAELDSWLGSSEPDPQKTFASSEIRSGYAAISIGRIEVKPRLHTLLDTTNGTELDIKYSFNAVTPDAHESLLSINLYFENRSLETMYNIRVMTAKSEDDSHDVGSAGAIAGSDSRISVLRKDVSKLERGCKTEGQLSVNFKDNHKLLRLIVCYSGKTYSLKVTPDIGALMRPYLLQDEAFSSAESSVAGTHEILRRLTIIVPLQVEGSSAAQDQVLLVARTVARRVLSVAHVSLVSTIMPITDSKVGVHTIQSSGVQGLCLKFSGKTLPDHLLCLVKVTVLTEIMSRRDEAELEVLLKINCEDITFGSSLSQELCEALISSV